MSKIHPFDDMSRLEHSTPAPSRKRRGTLVRWALIGGLCLAAVALAVSCSKSTPSGTTAKAVQYHCPMHPTVISDKPGDCPICGMKLVPMKPAATTQSKSVKYTCPMDPQVISDKPGDCPICGMKLVPMKDVDQDVQAATPKKKIMYRSTMTPGEISDKPGKDAMGMEMVPFEVTEGGGSSTVPGLAAVAITPEVRQVMGLRLGTVERRSMAPDVRTSALIVADESSLHQVTVKVEGWVDKLFVDVTGQTVRRGDPLLTLYSPELVSAQEDYLIALGTADTMASQSLLAATKRKLQLLDVSDRQIEELEKTRRAQKSVTLYSPASGIVLDKQVVSGYKIMPDQPLMTIADLSVVWGEADIYQSDLPYVKIGMPLELTLSYWPDQTFEGKVVFISPTMNSESRTLRARLEIPNRDGLLKPGMYADAHFSYPLGDKLGIPASAVMFSGNGTYAFKDGGDGRLIPTQIKIGARGNDWYEVLDGLQEGDRVVVSANFLVDSESSLRAALEAMTNGSQQTGQGE